MLKNILNNPIYKKHPLLKEVDEIVPRDVYPDLYNSITLVTDVILTSRIETIYDHEQILITNKNGNEFINFIKKEGIDKFNRLVEIFDQIVPLSSKPVKPMIMFYFAFSQEEPLIFDGLDLRGINFRGASFLYVEFNDCNLTNANFTFFDGGGLQFNNCKMDFSNFDDMRVKGVSVIIDGQIINSWYPEAKRKWIKNRNNDLTKNAVKGAVNF